MWSRFFSVAVWVSLYIGGSAQSRELEYGDYFGSLPHLEWAPPLDSIKQWKLKKVTAVRDADSVVFIFDRRRRLKRILDYDNTSERRYRLKYDWKGNFRTINMRECAQTDTFSTVEQFDYAYTKDGVTRVIRKETRGDAKAIFVDTCDFMRNGDTLLSLKSAYFGSFWRTFQSCGDTLKETKRMPRWDHFHQKMDTAQILIWHVRNNRDQLVLRQYRYIHYTSDCGVGMPDEEHWRYDAQGRLVQYEDVRFGYTDCFRWTYDTSHSVVQLSSCSMSHTAIPDLRLDMRDYFWLERLGCATDRYYFVR
jgi:hypothetical protein